LQALQFRILDLLLQPSDPGRFRRPERLCWFLSHKHLLKNICFLIGIGYLLKVLSAEYCFRPNHRTIFPFGLLVFLVQNQKVFSAGFRDACHLQFCYQKGEGMQCKLQRMIAELSASTSLAAATGRLLSARFDNLTEIAKAAGVTKQGISRALLTFKDEVGLRICAGKRDYSRDAYRNATEASIAAGTHWSSKQRKRASGSSVPERLSSSVYA
jgi:hypothetical protein